MKLLFLRIAVVVLAAASPAGAQETAADKYNAAFGAEDKAVKRTSDTRDDLQFSLKLLKSAKSASNTGAFRVMLYEKAYEFAARRASGYKQAIEALNYLTKAVPDRKTEWLGKKLKTMTQRYVNSYGAGREEIVEPYLATMLALADDKLKEGKAAEAQILYRRACSVAVQIKSPLLAEIREKAAKLADAAALERRTEQYKRALAAKPSVRNRENLIYHYIADLDSPKEAFALITDDVNKDLLAYLPLVVAPESELIAPGCMELAKWYESLAKRPISSTGRLNVYQRARGYYAKFLALNTKAGLDQLLAKRALARLDKFLDKMDPGRLTIDCGGGANMRLTLLKTGKFLLGSPTGESGRGSDEGPQVTVTISKAFYIGLAEVTQQQYTAVMGANPSTVKGPLLPVTNVTPAGARAFCRKLSALSSRTARLPTEAEWEYACRAGSTTAFCFGNDAARLGDYAWISSNSPVDKKPQPHAVGGKRANAWGLFDMHGNVWELALRPYSSLGYAGAAGIDPQDPSKCRSSLQKRGGSAARDASFCRSANRLMASSSRGDSFTGFRVLIEAKQAKKPAAPTLR